MWWGPSFFRDKALGLGDDAVSFLGKWSIKNGQVLYLACGHQHFCAKHDAHFFFSLICKITFFQSDEAPGYWKLLFRGQVMGSFWFLYP